MTVVTCGNTPSVGQWTDETPMPGIGRHRGSRLLGVDLSKRSGKPSGRGIPHLANHSSSFTRLPETGESQIMHPLEGFTDPLAVMIRDAFPRSHHNYDPRAVIPVVRRVHELKQLGIEVTPDLVQRIVDMEAHSFQVTMLYRQSQKKTNPVPDGSIVYYMRIGNRVKIGTTTNLPQRLAVINPEELMAIEPGGLPQEKARHRLFANLRTHGEWFRLESPLKEYIADLADKPMGVAS